MMLTVEPQLNPRHLSKTNEHYTPEWLAEASRVVLGRIDLDPASCVEANKVIQATYFFDKEDDGLNKQWGEPKYPSSVFLNPPGGKVKTKVKEEKFDEVLQKLLVVFSEDKKEVLKSQQKLFWQKLLDEVAKGHIKAALFLSFSVEALQTTQLECSKAMLDFPVCIFKRRVSYTDQQGNKQPSPPHSSCIIYVPGTEDNTDLFVNTFMTFGRIVEPVF